MAKSGLLPDGIAANIMIPNPFCVSEDKLAIDVLKAMMENKVMSAVVVNGGNVVGIVTGSSFIGALSDHQAGEWLSDEPVSTIMAVHPYCVAPSTLIRDIIREMAGRRIRHVIVTDVLRPVGIISHVEVLKWWVEEKKNKKLEPLEV